MPILPLLLAPPPFRTPLFNRQNEMVAEWKRHFLDAQTAVNALLQFVQHFGGSQVFLGLDDIDTGEPLLSVVPTVVPGPTGPSASQALLGLEDVDTGEPLLSLTLGAPGLQSPSASIVTIALVGDADADEPFPLIPPSGESGEFTSKITRYNNIATTAWGVLAIYGSGRSTGQTGAVASVATYTVGAADGSFLVSMNILVTAFTAGTISGVVTYTDEGGTARSLTLNFSSVGGVLSTTAGAAGAFEGVPLHIRAKASTAITCTTTVSVFTGTYNVEAYISQLG